MTPKDEVLQEINSLIPTGEKLDQSYASGEMGHYYSNVPEAEFRSFVTSAVAIVERVAGNDSPYYKSLPHEQLSEQLASLGYDKSPVATIVGVLNSLRDAVEKDYLTSLESRLRANVHDDFLTQANDLLRGGYYVAAIVIAGGVLENHLLKMVEQRGLTWKGSGSLSKYNDLLKDTYPKSTWRQVQAISDIRNNAAHGKTESVNVDDVSDALKYISRLLTDYPA